VLDEGGDRQREESVLGVNLRRPIVTNGDFATQLFPNCLGQDLFTFCASCIIITARCYTSTVYVVVMCLSVRPSVTHRYSVETAKLRITQTMAHDNPET